MQRAIGIISRRLIIYFNATPIFQDSKYMKSANWPFQNLNVDVETEFAILVSKFKEMKF